MAKPKNMTAEQEAAWKERNRQRVKDWQKANPDKKRQNQNEWAKNNPESNRERQRRFYAKNRERILGKHREYRESNLTKSRARVNKSMCKRKTQTASDQFFIMAGAAEQISKITNNTNTNENNTDSK